MVIDLSGKNKLCFVDGNIPRLVANSPNLKARDGVNNIVIGWILSALNPIIAKSVIWFKTEREIWVELEERYGQSSTAELFAL